jgi:hypothetical protein
LFYVVGRAVFPGPATRAEMQKGPTGYPWA